MKKGKIIIIVVAVLILVAGGFGTFYFYNKYQEIKKNPDIVAKEETAALKEKVGALMVLPSNEEPTVATITDVDKLKEQDFFKDAKNGDKLLAYVENKKAILYRPSTNKIINVAPIYISTETDDTTKEE